MNKRRYSQKPPARIISVTKMNVKCGILALQVDEVLLALVTLLTRNYESFQHRFFVCLERTEMSPESGSSLIL